MLGCNSLLCILPSSVKTQDRVVDVLPMTVLALPNRKRSESGCFLSEPVRLWQPSFLPSLLISLISSPTLSSSCPFPNTSMVCSWASWSCVMYCHIGRHCGTLALLSHGGQEGSGWASLPSHIMAVGKLPSVCSSHDTMPVSILNSFVFLWKWRKPSLNHRFIWKDMHH